MSNIFISLLLAASISFAAPAVIVGCAIACLNLVGYFPGFWELSNHGIFHILEFLAVFGNGRPLQGIVTLGITVSIVGISLDILNFYRNSYCYQSFNEQDIS